MESIFNCSIALVIIAIFNINFGCSAHFSESSFQAGHTCDVEDEVVAQTFSQIPQLVKTNLNFAQNFLDIQKKIQLLEQSIEAVRENLKDVQIKLEKCEQTQGRLKSDSQGEIQHEAKTNESCDGCSVIIVTPDNYQNSTEIVIQRRMDGSVDFQRTWSEYKLGFGSSSGEFWIGLEKLHKLTNSRPHELLIVMEDWENDRRYARYDQFIVGSESEQYTLKSVGKYSGSAGDSLSYHLGEKFTTKDQDNDKDGGNCAITYTGAWWHKSCHQR